MKDFGYTNINGYVDIDFLNETTTKEAIVYNAIFEVSRIIVAPQTQPIEKRGGSVKNTIYNTTGENYGTLIWFDKTITNGQEATKNIKSRVEKKLTELVQNDEIISFDNLNVIFADRQLTIRFYYNYNNQRENFNLKQYI